MKSFGKILLILLAMLAASPHARSAPPGGNTKAKSEQTQRKTRKQPAKRRSDSQRRSSQAKETSADLRRRQEQTQAEIRKTKEELRVNESEVKRNLNELGKLEGDIAESKGRVDEAAARVRGTSRSISLLETQISKGEAELARLRAEYLKAVKKMRATKGSRSTLAFIFSSGSFRQAMQRMRYLKQFGAWRDKKTSELKKSVATLSRQRDDLAKTRVMHQNALAKETGARNALQAQYVRQDALVVSLRRNGDVLRTHLASKQAEANTLKNQVASVIAAEQAAAEKARAEKARAEQAAAAKRAAEQAAAERAVAERAAAEKAAADRAAAERAVAEKNAAEKAREEQLIAAREKESKKEAKKDPKKEVRKESKQERKRESAPVRVAEPEKTASSGGEYANARRRRPRGNKQAAAPSAAAPSAAAAPAKNAVPAKSNGGGFAGMKGSLPRPVGGSFKVTSRFGRHSLPDMPDVMFDNPGIDAEVANGASVQAVYAGKVSGVYMVPGFSTVVIVNHGDYYTVYGNLSSASVKVGDSVQQGHSLGRVAPDEDDSSHGSIHFEVWKNRDKQDPLQWIR